MTLQQTIDKTREELIKDFQPRQFAKRGCCETYCKKEIKRAFRNVEMDRATLELFGKNPFYEMIENAFIWKAILKCEV